MIIVDDFRALYQPTVSMRGWDRDGMKITKKKVDGWRLLSETVLYGDERDFKERLARAGWYTAKLKYVGYSGYDVDEYFISTSGPFDEKVYRHGTTMDNPNRLRNLIDRSQFTGGIFVSPWTWPREAYFQREADATYVTILNAVEKT